MRCLRRSAPLDARLAGSSGADTLPPPLLSASDSFPLILPGSGDSLLLAGGHFYAIAADRKSVTVLTLEGRKLRSFGAGELVSAVSVALAADGTAYVVDQSAGRNGEIDRFDPAGKHLGSFIGRDFSRLSNTFYPKIATVGADGRLYVVTLFDIQVFSSQGTLQEVYPARGNAVVIDDAVALPNGDLLYSAAFELRLLGANGVLKRTYTAADFGRERLLTLGAAVAADGTIYVTDVSPDSAGGGRLLRIGKDGTPLLPLPYHGGAGKVAAGPDGELYLYANHQLTRFHAEELDPMAPWARYYRPALYFDSSEPWRPLNVNSFLREVNPNKGGHEVCKAQGLRNDLCTAAPGGEARDCPDWNCSSPATALAQLTRQDKHSGYYLDISDARNHPKLATCDGSLNHRCDYDGGETNALYYHAFASRPGEGVPEGTVFFDYWAFYRYNHSPVNGYDNHEGDWEGTLVAALPACASSNPSRGIDCRLGGAQGQAKCAARDGILWVGIRSHQYYWRYLCNVTSFNGSHVRTYVAAGSHATYPRPCGGTDCNQNTRQGQAYAGEGRYNGQSPWKSNAASCDSEVGRCVSLT